MTKLSYQLIDGTITNSYEKACKSTIVKVIFTKMPEPSAPISAKRKAMLETYGKVVKRA